MVKAVKTKERCFVKTSYLAGLLMNKSPPPKAHDLYGKGINVVVKTVSCPYGITSTIVLDISVNRRLRRTLNYILKHTLPTTLPSPEPIHTLTLATT